MYLKRAIISHFSDLELLLHRRPLCAFKAFNSKVKRTCPWEGGGGGVEWSPPHPRRNDAIMHTTQTLLKLFRRCPWFQHFFMPCFSKKTSKALEERRLREEVILLHIPRTRSNSQNCNKPKKLRSGSSVQVQDHPDPFITTEGIFWYFWQHTNLDLCSGFCKN